MLDFTAKSFYCPTMPERGNYDSQKYILGKGFSLIRPVAGQAVQTLIDSLQALRLPEVDVRRIGNPYRAPAIKEISSYDIQRKHWMYPGVFLTSLYSRFDKNIPEMLEPLEVTFQSITDTPPTREGQIFIDAILDPHSSRLINNERQRAIRITERLGGTAHHEASWRPSLAACFVFVGGTAVAGTVPELLAKARQHFPLTATALPVLRFPDPYRADVTDPA